MNLKTYYIEEFADLDKYFRRNLMNCLSGYKSLNLVGTISKEGKTNLAPFSQIFHIGASPALMGMLIRPDVVPRHTLANLEETGYFTFNHVQADFYKQAHQSAARYEESEFEAVGLEAEFSEKIPAPYVQKSLLRIGLKFEERHDLAINGTVMIIGSVQEIHVMPEAVGEDGFINLEKLESVTCSGLDSYHIGQKLGRLSYPKPDKNLSII
jgi:flavin reductase (DIM6/NTAB) family NADH-FMN oxidoreductase RutF